MRNECSEYRKKLLDNINNKKYPQIGKINLEEFKFMDLDVKYFQTENVKKIPEDLQTKIDDENNIIIIKDGNMIYNNLSETLNNVIIKTYYDALATNDEVVLNKFREQFLQDTDNKLIDLNKIYQNSFLYLKVPKNFVAKEEIKLYILGENSDLIHHTIIVCEENSELTLVEKIDSIKGINVNYVNEVEVQENAKLNYISIDCLSDSSSAFINREGIVYANGSLIYALGQLNNSNTVSNNHIRLIGENAYCESRNFLFTDKDNLHAITVNIEHLAPFSYGKIINHGIVKDKGYLYIDGIGKIHQGMNQANSKQTTHIINLSDDAKVTVNPYLLIDEFDVQAGHGAGVGKINEEQLFYLMSRGLSKQEAERLIIIGFLYPIIEMITSENIKTSFIKAIESKLLN